MDDFRTTGEMRWGEGWDEEDVDPPEAQEVANSGNESYEGKESKSICSGGRSLELWEPCQELSYLEGCHPHIPRVIMGDVDVRGMCRAAEEMGHRVVCGVAIGAGGVIGPAFWMAVMLEPWKVTGSDLEKGASERPGQQLFGWVHWKGGSGHDHFVRCMRLNDILYHPTS